VIKEQAKTCSLIKEQELFFNQGPGDLFFIYWPGLVVNKLIKETSPGQ
jgi:hypothetical protein